MGDLMGKDDGERMAVELRVAAPKRIAGIRSDAEARIAVIRAEAEAKRARVMREFTNRLSIRRIDRMQPSAQRPCPNGGAIKGLVDAFANRHSLGRHPALRGPPGIGDYPFARFLLTLASFVGAP